MLMMHQTFGDPGAIRRVPLLACPAVPRGGSTAYRVEFHGQAMNHRRPSDSIGQATLPRPRKSPGSSKCRTRVRCGRSRPTPGNPTRTQHCWTSQQWHPALWPVDLKGRCHRSLGQRPRPRASRNPSPERACQCRRHCGPLSGLKGVGVRFPGPATRATMNPALWAGPAGSRTRGAERGYPSICTRSIASRRVPLLACPAVPRGGSTAYRVEFHGQAMNHRRQSDSIGQATLPRPRKSPGSSKCRTRLRCGRSRPTPGNPTRTHHCWTSQQWHPAIQ